MRRAFYSDVSTPYSIASLFNKPRNMLLPNLNFLFKNESVHLKFCFFELKVFKPDKQNSFEIQSEADALIDRQSKKESVANAAKNPKSKLGKLSDPTGKLVNIEEDHIYAVFISCIEIYNNYIYDLLDDFNPSSDSAKCVSSLFIVNISN